ncbi:MAG TPA: flagellar hook-associated protein 2 [Pseudogracilibacillus sp.]|nr:flagellar hook-associated protein 2 [Pseudogracilibacillus sp.]
MVMRVGGIVSGMDIEAMVEKLMEAERMPLERLRQQQTQLEWKRDAFRDINSKLLELDNMMLDMKLSRTYNPKATVSSNEGAVTATASSSASNGTYDIRVEQLATRAMNIGESIEYTLQSEMSADVAGTYTYYTYDQNGEAIEHEFTVEEGDTLNQVLRNIERASEGNVRAFFDESQNRVVLEATRSGAYNENGAEITFEGNTFFTNTLGLSQGNESGGKNAIFTYNNGLTIESRENSYTLNGVTFEFHNVTETNVSISVQNDVDTSFEKIMDFVNKYNEVIEAMNQSQTEERYRDYLPLTEEQKAEMTDKQIELWEEKAKSGILRGEAAIQNGMFSLRGSLQGKVETGGEYTLLSQIGITTTKNYLDGGKLEVDEEKLKAALRDNPDDVYKLFANNTDGESKGIIHRFDESLDRVRGNIERQAGRSTQTLDNYTLGKEMKRLNERITDYERRMVQVEQRYWSQFTAMEKAIARLSDQANYLFSQFGGMQ